jgi:cytochrome bd-type quinol oxidase subunit 2
MMQSESILAWKTPIVRYAILVVLAHLIINSLHGIAHQQVRVSISDLQSAYVFLVILVVPIAGAILLLLNRPKEMQQKGAWLLLASMLGSLLFGLTYHIVLPSPDNIFTVMQGPSLDNAIYTLTAILLVIIDGLGSWLGAIAIRRMAKFAP